MFHDLCFYREISGYILNYPYLLVVIILACDSVPEIAALNVVNHY